MLTEISFNNFKNLKRVHCHLSRLTVIVGANATGKTSILEATHYLSQLVRKHTGENTLALFRGTRSLEVLYGGSDGETLAIEARSAESLVNFKASRNQASCDRMKLGDSGWFGGIIGRESAASSNSVDPLSDGNTAANLIRSLVFLHFEASQLAKPSYSPFETPRVEYSGAGLPSALATMMLEEPDNFKTVLEMMQRVVPHLVNIRFKRRKVWQTDQEVVEISGVRQSVSVPRAQMGEALVFDFANRKDIPATNVSEGTLLALGLITVLSSPTKPRMVLLDDIEKGLHPEAQKALVGILRELLDLYPDLQILATSHSPLLLDYLDPTEVRLTALDQDGYTHCGNLTDHPSFEKWREELAPGEMWSLFGEGWMLESSKATP